MEGFADRDFASVEEAFAGQLERTDGGAAVTIFHRGEPVVDLWGGLRTPEGDPWESDTLAMCFSTTKGVASVALHLQAEAGLVDYDERVATYWPEFAQNGKENITVRHVLSHSAGLHRLRSVIDSAHHMLDWEHMVDGARSGTAGLRTRHPVRLPRADLRMVGRRDRAASHGLAARRRDRSMTWTHRSASTGCTSGVRPEQRHRVAALAPMRVFGPRVPRVLHRDRRGDHGPVRQGAEPHRIAGQHPTHGQRAVPTGDGRRDGRTRGDGRLDPGCQRILHRPGAGHDVRRPRRRRRLGRRAAAVARQGAPDRRGAEQPSRSRARHADALAARLSPGAREPRRCSRWLRPLRTRRLRRLGRPDPRPGRRHGLQPRDREPRSATSA